MSFYRQNAQELAAQYNSLSSDVVHGAWKHLLPGESGLAADIGAGSGRDANWLADQGWNVVAVEPEAAFREPAREHSHAKVSWVDDTLPRLTHLRAMDMRFDLILVSAVWMHLSPSDRNTAFRVLSNLLAPDGLLVISVRHEADAGVRESRGFYEVSAEELPAFAKQHALVLRQRHRSDDALGRSAVSWETLCFQLPDDGTGSLPLLRHIIVNDNKSASYKLGLLRALIRIAEGAPGLVLARDDDWVTIPFGAVGLYWIKLYSQAILEYDLPQHPNSHKGYGFAGAHFRNLSEQSRFDLRLGSRFSGDDAKTLTGAISAACGSISQNPAHYTKHPRSSNTVFEAEKTGVRGSAKPIELNRDYLARFGTFRVPAALWLSMSQYACWLEPAIVNEWVKLMQGWDEKRRGRPRDVRRYLNGLEWRQDKRDTTLARGRFSALAAAGTSVQCTWSGTRLNNRNFVVDHCFPWSRWFNNDLWNLLPAADSVNGRKGDKLPSADLLIDSRERIVTWWEMAYADQDLGRRFFTEAQGALPLLSDAVADYDTVFSAVMLQRKKLRANQQLPEWAG